MALRIAVIGHVEHITIGRVDSVPREGEIAHLLSPRCFSGGGGGVAFHQLAKSAAEVLLFTAIGDDDAGRFVEAEIAKTGASIFCARRAEPHTRDVVMVTPRGERTILVVGEPLHPNAEDALPWGELASCDAAYFTAQDPEVLKLARRARLLVATARRRSSITRSGVGLDVIVGSSNDSRESSTLADYPVAPKALVMTAGRNAGRIEEAGIVRTFEPVPVEHIVGGAYGAGDSFAGALVYYLAAGLDTHASAQAAARYGAAVLSALCPLDAQLSLPMIAP